MEIHPQAVGWNPAHSHHSYSEVKSWSTRFLILIRKKKQHFKSQNLRISSLTLSQGSAWIKKRLQLKTLLNLWEVGKDIVIWWDVLHLFSLFSWKCFLTDHRKNWIPWKPKKVIILTKSFFSISISSWLRQEPVNPTQ